MRKQYESPEVTSHEKLVDITGSFGSGSGGGGGDRPGGKGGKEWFKEGKDGW